MRTLQNFNISVAVTEAFMAAVEHDDEYDLINPRDGGVAGRLRAREVFQLLVSNAWKNGDPGIVFIDRINRDNPTPNAGRDRGDQPLRRAAAAAVRVLQPRLAQPRALREAERARAGRPARGAAGLGAPGTGDPACVRFLDNVIEMNRYPMPEIDEATKLTARSAWA